MIRPTRTAMRVSRDDLVIAVVILAWLGLGIITVQRNHTTHDATPPAALIDLNRADAALLTAIPNIGPALAERLVTHRAAHGHWTAIEQLGDVKGIGPATIQRMRPYVICR